MKFIKNKQYISTTIIGLMLMILCWGCYHASAKGSIEAYSWIFLALLNTMSFLSGLYMLFGFKVDKDHMIYTWKHKMAFLKVEKQLLGHNTLRGYLHDCDKLFLYLFLDGEEVHHIHRRYSRHHIDKAFTESDYIQMIIDWECGRLTKPDKPLDAYDTLYKWFEELECVILPLLIRFNLTHGREKATI